MPLDVIQIRSEFPALSSGVVFLDNPAGTQVPQRVIDQINNYLVHTNANQGGAFATSEETDAMLLDTRSTMADFINASSPSEIMFGPNMTTLTMAISRCLAREFKPDDEIIVTHLDHDANISPWLLLAEDKGCRVRWVDFDVQDCTLRMDQLEELLNERTRLVAVGYASNAVGTINPVKEITRLAHQVGALCYVDAVQYAPHGEIDVQDLDCDFLVVSAYKFFGPHLGVLYGKLEHLKSLQAYRVRPAPTEPPGKFETGTPTMECIAGLLGALQYLEHIGSSYGSEYAQFYAPQHQERRLRFKQGMAAIRAYETELTQILLEALSQFPNIRIYGITDLHRLDQRVPTVSFTCDGIHPRLVAESLGRLGINVWDGNYYALAVTTRLGLEERGGMVRVGPVHYNTQDEIRKLERCLGSLVF